MGEAVADPISYGAEIHSMEAVSQSVLQELRATLGTLASRVRIERWDSTKGAWLSVDRPTQTSARNCACCCNWRIAVGR